MGETTYLGIDPGLSGALALVSADRKLLALADMPTRVVRASRRAVDASVVVDLLDDWTWQHGPPQAVLETVGVRPKQSAQSGVKSGVGWGILAGILAARKIPWQEVQPQKWQKAIIGAVPRGTAKGEAALHASRMFPDADLGKRKSQDRADAICIALYARLQGLGL